MIKFYLISKEAFIHLHNSYKWVQSTAELANYIMNGHNYTFNIKKYLPNIGVQLGFIQSFMNHTWVFLFLFFQLYSQQFSKLDGILFN